MGDKSVSSLSLPYTPAHTPPPASLRSVSPVHLPHAGAVDDIPLAPLPAWGLAEAPVALVPPKPAARRSGRGASRGHIVGGAVGFLSVIAVEATVIGLGCKGKLGSPTYNGETWDQVISDPNSGLTGQPNKPDYGQSDQCVYVGAFLGVFGTLIGGLACATLGAWVGGTISRRRGATAAVPMDSVA